MRANRYEALGIRALYVMVAKLVHEDLLPPARGQVGNWTKEHLETIRAGTYYFAAANVARSVCYVPQAIAFTLAHYWPGQLYVGLIWAAHGLLVVVESYKRVLCDQWLPVAELEEAQPTPLPAETPPGLFRLRKFETERFYRRIGLEAFRQFVTWMMSALTYGLSGRRMVYIAQPSRHLAVAFERATRVSETVHLCSALSVAPLVVLSWIGAPLGVAIWSTVIVWGDLMLALLQRYHRSRVWPVIRRMMERQG